MNRTHTINKEYRCVIKAIADTITLSVQQRYWFILWREIDYHSIVIENVDIKVYPDLRYPRSLHMTGYGRSYKQEYWPLNTFSLTDRLKEIHDRLMQENEAMRVCANEALGQVMHKTKLNHETE